ncbi:DNA-3-methyladenine glycosylase family protein [Roseimaritima ulvae]|uniref:DNA-3-methyladenine glycosylase II n=1 Tax=Roseimaritima ulvae TaxID=980254 RepID=A0A5B9QXN6_9BACT|nr:DNA-3-methyladenine glycosylase [Roseimaritima ulvae]QEG42772.1 DNA-3-methyladenine glycosylase [Roseimaritima ulvae]
MSSEHEAKRLQSRFRRRLRAGEKSLSAKCPALGAWIAVAGKSDWEVAWQRSLYQALVMAIAHQQLHGNAARAILQRFEAGFRGEDFPSPHQVGRASTDKLRAMGFSAAKVTAIQGIAAAARKGDIPSRQQAEQMSDDELVEHLVTLRGVGRWTVEMLLIFTLGRMDVMPVDDYGVRSGLRSLCELESLPGKRDFARLTDHWRPHRSLAAWYLWRLADANKPPPK